MAFDILEARQTLYDAITAAVGILVAPENQAFPNVEIKNPGATPRLEVIQIATSTPVLDLKGNIITEEGALQMYLVGERGGGEGATLAIAQIIRDAIPATSAWAVTGGGTIALRGHPQIGAGYPDNTAWRQPMEISYYART